MRVGDTPSGTERRHRRPAARTLAALALLANVGFYLPSVPSPGPAVGGIPGIDGIYHVGTFALTVWAVGRLLAPSRRFPIGWVVLVAVAHGALIEAVQGAALPHRSADPGDVLADLVGIVLGLGLWCAERRWSPLSRPAPPSARDPERPPAGASCTGPAGPR